MADASEAFLFTRMIDALRVAEECARGLAIARADTNWLTPAKMLGHMHENVKKLAHASARQALHIVGEQMARRH